MLTLCSWKIFKKKKKFFEHVEYLKVHSYFYMHFKCPRTICIFSFIDKDYEIFKLLHNLRLSILKKKVTAVAAADFQIIGSLSVF